MYLVDPVSVQCKPDISGSAYPWRRTASMLTLCFPCLAKHPLLVVLVLVLVLVLLLFVFVMPCVPLLQVSRALVM
jgi:hypothetical protein